MAKTDLYRRLLDDIRRRHWRPGQVLTQQQLASHYQTSRIPVRDAMTRLAAAGYLVAAGKASLMVPALSAAEASELSLIRLQLEPLALREAAVRLTHQQLGAAEDLLQQAAALQQQADPLRLGELNWQFHYTLYQSCQLPVLLQLLTQLHDKVAMYLGVQELSLGYANRSLAEHQQLLVLLRQGKTEAAVALLTEHIRDANTALQQQLAQAPQ